MEGSVLRIAKYLSSISERQVFLYARESVGTPEESEVYRAEGIICVDLKQTVSAILRPLPLIGTENDKFRVEALVFKMELQKQMTAKRNTRHIVVSFLISTNGFIAQHVADELCLPHIACVRGTDFSRDFYGLSRFAAIGHVVKRATWVVTVNNTQCSMLKKAFDRDGRILTVFNAMEQSSRRWTRSPSSQVRLFSDVGYSFKKGTHLLVTAVEELLAEKLPIQLTIVGREIGTEKGYWSRFKAAKIKEGGEIRFADHVPSGEVEGLILQSDIYCSASLGEGCANGSLRALLLNIPIVATDCGALPELSQGIKRVFLSSVGDLEGFKNNVRNALNFLDVADDSDLKLLSALGRRLAPDNEYRQWLDILNACP